MCNTLVIDPVFIMWVIGGASLGWFGMKSFKQYVIRKKKSKNGEQSELEKQDFSLKGN